MKHATKIDHIAFAVKNLEESLHFYEAVLGLEVTHRETIEAEKIKVAFVRIGESFIELMEPTSEDSFVARSMKKHGQGFAHLCFATQSVDRIKDRIDEEGLMTLGDVREGAEGRRVLFLHPKDNAGVLTEFSEQAEDE